MRSFERDAAGRPERGWVDLIASRIGASVDAEPAEGFRGLWRTREWTLDGEWSQPDTDDECDAAPFGYGFVSSGTSIDEASWKKVAGTTVAAFDLYSLAVPNAGDWQYRVDDGPWQNVSALPDPTGKTLTKWFVEQPVKRRVQIRGFDGTAPCVVAIAGIGTYASLDDDPSRTRVHDLGVVMQPLGWFARWSRGDPMAVLDDLRPELVVTAFTNDFMWRDPAPYGATLRRLIERVRPTGEVLVISSFEQRPPRSVSDATTTKGSRVIVSDAADFEASDVRSPAAGTHIVTEPPTTLESVESSREATLSAPATGDTAAGELILGLGREADVQAAFRAVDRMVAAELACPHLDLYDAWAAAGAEGWQSAFDQDLMFDRYHASSRGQDDISSRILAMLEFDPDASHAGGLTWVVPRPTPAESGAIVAGGRPLVIPGTGAVSAPRRGSVEVEVPVTLSPASSDVVTVRWRTAHLDHGPPDQAPPSHYVPAAGQLVFAPGQTEANVSITVTANDVDRTEQIIVYFDEPTNADMGGYFGLGVGTIESAT